MHIATSLFSVMYYMKRGPLIVSPSVEGLASSHTYCYYSHKGWAEGTLALGAGALAAAPSSVTGVTVPYIHHMMY